MNTRSQTRYNNTPLYEVDIDFDEASAAWRANKNPLQTEPLNIFVVGSQKQEISVTDNPC